MTPKPGELESVVTSGGWENFTTMGTRQIFLTKTKTT